MSDAFAYHSVLLWDRRRDLHRDDVREAGKTQ
jgi:hypothetical protein